MSISVKCPQCGTVLFAPEDRAGRAANCPVCKTRMVIPPMAQTVVQAPPIPFAEPVPEPPVQFPLPVKPRPPVPVDEDAEYPPPARRRPVHGDYEDDDRPRRKRRRRREDDDEDDYDDRPRRRQSAGNVVHITNVVNAQGGYHFPHGLHLILTILTCGFWLPVWILHYIAHAVLG